MKVLIKVNNEWIEASNLYVKDNDAWTEYTQSQLETYLGDKVMVFGGNIDGDHQLTIEGFSEASGVTCSLAALYDGKVDVTSAATWTIISGSTFATIDNTGLVTILSNASGEDIIVGASYNSLSAHKTVNITYQTGTTAQTETEVVTDESGNTSVTVITTVTNDDGSTSSSASTVTTDESGNTIGSTESTTNTEADGSYNSTTTNYDADGNPTDGQNASGDTQGNVNTQGVTYDASGNSAVTSYSIDTSDNPEGSKPYNGDGVNTEYYAFDVTRGFIVDMHFTVDCSNKPPGQNENLHNILTAKRATPSPWYGFQLRQPTAGKYVQLGTQFSTGSNTNTTIRPLSITGNTAEYDLQIIYDPTLSTDSFICKNKATGAVIYRSNGKFPDIEELKYLKVTVGYAMDENGDPFRYSSINVMNFSIRRLTKAEIPTITCDGQMVTIDCETVGAAIYYRLNQVGVFAPYAGPFAITADTVVEAYAKIDDDRSETAIKNCTYDSGIEGPVIYCDGEEVAITCDTSGTTIYYKLNNTGEYAVYSAPFAITADTVVEAYAELNGAVSRTVTETCIYNPDLDYSKEYLTFRIISGGTIAWQAFGSGYNRSIQYSINNGAWETITASSSAPSFSVSEGDTVRFRGASNTYAGSNVDYDGFGGSTAIFDIEGNIMSLVYGDNFVNNTGLTGSYNFCSLFKATSAISAENLVLPATTLTNYCYRAMFSKCPNLVAAPALPATTLAQGCYWHMFEECPITEAPELLAEVLVRECYGYMFTGCQQLNYIRCLATDISAASATTSWVLSVASSGTFVKDANTDWPIDAKSGIPTRWVVVEEGLKKPAISCDGLHITLTCDAQGASIYYRLNEEGAYAQYATPIAITADTVVYAYSQSGATTSDVVKETCIYDDGIEEPIIECDGVEVTITCYSVGADIYYRLNQEGTYDLYVSAITITADTIVQAYSELSGETSQVVTENCVYDPTHDYSKDYLTFNVLSDGTICWNSIGTGQSKTIQYSVNNGPWSSITASSATTIPVLTGDTVRFKGSNTSYAKDKFNYSGFEGGTASFNIEGNIMSLVYGGNFEGRTGLTGTYNFCSLFKATSAISAENLVLPATTLTNYCYRAMFSKCPNLVAAPALPATTLAQGCYWFMFEECPITEAPELLAEVLVRECYGYMFTGCRTLNYIKCMAIDGFSTYQCKQNWAQNVAASGTFVKDASITTTTWSRGASGIPSGWLVYDDVPVLAPTITCDGYNNVTITCDTPGATIYYKTGLTRSAGYTVYTTPFTITEDTVVDAYSELNGQESRAVSQTCMYISDDPYEASNRDLTRWTYNNTEVTTPYSVNALDGHSASYAKGTFNFETNVALREVQPTYLWFQHADQSATIYVDNVQVEKHWGGYTAFFVDITNYVHAGTNNIKVALKNNEGNNLAPASGDFNFNATLGNVKLFTSPYVPAMNYGYDGFHVQATATTASATIKVKTSVPTGATVVCTIDDGTYHFSDSGSSTNAEMEFTANISNPHLWNGTLDPHLYTITLEIYHGDDLYHRYVRPYGLRFYEYIINQPVNGNTYTGFLLNGQPYLLRGCCMHDDIVDKANALNDADYTTTFATIQELGCNFLRLAHYPHPKETYDWCDRLGIVVQTEGPCVNKMQSTMPTDYYDHLNTQYDDMVNQHYNHPCIIFWGLSNETTTDDKDFAKAKINGYIARIKALDSSRLVGYVMAQGPGSDPSAYYNNPDADWFGCNIYDGWYTAQNSNNPTSSLNTRFRNVVTNKSKILCYSEYGCGGTQRCHSDDFMTTTTRGNNPRHDIEYMMWLHEGEIAAIKNFPQLAFTAQWQLFDIAVANRNEGYTVCLDGVNTSEDDSLRRLNNKGLVERDHVTKKDPFYLYKAWWNTTDKFVHICCKEYTKTTDRVIKCYTNDANNGKLSIYVNNTFVEEVTVTDNIALFTAANYSSGDVIRVEGADSNDTLTF